MTERRRCKNPECSDFIEEDRPAQSAYCKKCGADRPRAWKKENPTYVKPCKKGPEVEEARRQKRREATKRWRQEHRVQFRLQNNRHSQKSKKKKREMKSRPFADQPKHLTEHQPAPPQIAKSQRTDRMVETTFTLSLTVLFVNTIALIGGFYGV